MQNIEQILNCEMEEFIKMEELIKKKLKKNITFIPIENKIALKKIYILFKTSCEEDIDLECLEPEYLLYCGLYYSLNKNRKQAKLWYEKATELGNSYAMNNLGVYYQTKKNNITQAKLWYEKASELGNSYSMFNLGNYYKNYEKNMEKAKYWYEKASELGNSDAMTHLSYYYEDFEKNMEKAKYWYEKASELGNSNAMTHLSYYYEDFENNLEKAKYWYEKACELGNSNAIKSYLSLCYKEKRYFNDFLKIVTLEQLQNEFPQFNHFWDGRKKYITQGDCGICYENKDLILFDCLHHSYCLSCYLSLDKCGLCKIKKNSCFKNNVMFCLKC